MAHLSGPFFHDHFISKNRFPYYGMSVMQSSTIHLIILNGVLYCGMMIITLYF